MREGGHPSLTTLPVVISQAKHTSSISSSSPLSDSNKANSLPGIYSVSHRKPNNEEPKIEKEQLVNSPLDLYEIQQFDGNASSSQLRKLTVNSA